jgi:hypothetical protein
MVDKYMQLLFGPESFREGGGEILCNDFISEKSPLSPFAKGGYNWAKNFNNF